MSQADLARKLDVSTGTVGGWEVGAHKIRLHRLRKVARALKLDVSELLELMA